MQIVAGSLLWLLIFVHGFVRVSDLNQDTGCERTYVGVLFLLTKFCILLLHPPGMTFIKQTHR